MIFYKENKNICSFLLFKKGKAITYPEHSSVTLAKSFCVESFPKGKQPNIILYRITPNDQMSTYKEKELNRMNI